MTYTNFNPRNNTTPQREQADPRQSRAESGGYTFTASKWVQLDRFLVLGSEGGSYYASERQLTVEMAQNVLACIAENGIAAVDRIIEISASGRAPKNDPAIFALALAASSENLDTRRYALDNLSRVVRIGTHLAHFITYVESMRGWGRSLKRAVSDWFTFRKEDSLAVQLTKYANRDGWAMRDILRVSHAKPRTMTQQALFQYAVKGTISEDGDKNILEWLHALEALKVETDPYKAARLISQYRFQREHVPTELLTHAVTWDALFPNLGIDAIIRNLGAMSRVGYITTGSEAERVVARMVENTERLRSEKMHPIKILNAWNTYRTGRAVLGSSTWPVSQRIVDALNRGFYRAFEAVEPSGKNILVAADISGSMYPTYGGKCSGMNLTPADLAGAMSLVFLNTEPNVDVVVFSSGVRPLDLRASHTLEQYHAMTSGKWDGRSGTDCAKAWEYALESKNNYDAVVILTDSQTWTGMQHPHQAAEKYRASRNPTAKFVVVQCEANGRSIIDPSDVYGLETVGADTSVPQLVTDFIGERV